MGFVQSIFSTIFGIVGGIFKAILGLVGIGKKSEFYLELPEDQLVSSDQPAVVPPAPVTPSQTVAPPVEVKPTVATAVAPPQPTKAAVTPAISGFATNYLMVPGAALPSRRRPGPSLSPFLDMAKQVKAS